MKASLSAPWMSCPVGAHQCLQMPSMHWCQCCKGLGWKGKHPSVSQVSPVLEITEFVHISLPVPGQVMGCPLLVPAPPLPGGSTQSSNQSWLCSSPVMPGYTKTKASRAEQREQELEGAWNWGEHHTQRLEEQCLPGKRSRLSFQRDSKFRHPSTAWKHTAVLLWHVNMTWVQFHLL